MADFQSHSTGLVPSVRGCKSTEAVTGSSKISAYTGRVAADQPLLYKKLRLVQISSESGPVSTSRSFSVLSTSSSNGAKKFSGGIDAPSDPKMRWKVIELDHWASSPN